MKQQEILIIDDNQMTREILELLMEDEDYIVSSCPNGLAAFELIKEKCFSIFIIDYNLPEMLGDAVAAKIRTVCPQAFIIGFSVESKEKNFFDAGADKFVIKDDLPNNLINLIRQRE